MTITSLSTRAKVAITGLLLCVMVVVPFFSSASTIFQEIQALQQQIQVIRDAVVDAKGVGSPTFTEKQKMLADLSSLESNLASLQLAIGGKSKIRTNIISLEVNGNLQTFTASATIRYDDEIIDGKTEPAATTTYKYSFTPLSDKSEVKARARELRGYVIDAIATDTGLPPAMVKEEATLSFTKFANDKEVLTFMGGKSAVAMSIYDRLRGPGSDLLDMFGQYSVITDIIISSGGIDGNQGVDVKFYTDRNEILRLNIGTPCEASVVKAGHSCTVGAPVYIYTVTYYVHGVPVVIVKSPQSGSSDIFTFLANTLEDSEIWEIYGTEAAATSSLQGLPVFYGPSPVNYWGSYLLPKKPTGEDALAFHLTTFVTQQGMYFLAGGGYANIGTTQQMSIRNGGGFDSNGGALERFGQTVTNVCLSDRVKSSTIALMEYFIVGRLQHAAPLYQLTEWYTPIRTMKDETPRCVSVTDGDGKPIGGAGKDSYFPGLPVVDWEAAIKAADPDTDKAWFLQ